jgi:hypothetical protein
VLLTSIIAWYLWFLPGLSDKSVADNYTTPITIGTYIIAALVVVMYSTVNGRYFKISFAMYPVFFAAIVHMSNKIQDSKGQYMTF